MRIFPLDADADDGGDGDEPDIRNELTNGCYDPLQDGARDDGATFDCSATSYVYSGADYHEEQSTCLMVCPEGKKFESDDLHDEEGNISQTRAHILCEGTKWKNNGSPLNGWPKCRSK